MARHDQHRFRSILSGRPDGSAATGRGEPPFFRDLNLDQVLGWLTAGRAEYDLAPFFYAPLRDPASVEYRHEVMRDLERDQVFEVIRQFARRMRDMRDALAQAGKLHYQLQVQRWFLAVVEEYSAAVRFLAGQLADAEISSRGLLGFRDYLAAYLQSDRFASLEADTQRAVSDLAGVTYSIQIRGNRVRVSAYGGEPDYSTDVIATFARFQQGDVKDYRVKFRSWPDMNHVEARILDLVARLYPEVFQRLDAFYTGHQDYLDSAIAAFDREIQFYAAYRALIRPLKDAGLPFCYPRVSARSKEIRARDAFDIALASARVPGGAGGNGSAGAATGYAGTGQPGVVRNDLELRNPERIFVVTGPNQGGKTTFARMFGQLQYLASLGYPVPGREAACYLADHIYTHFEKEEDLETLRGKLEDELVRVHDILRHATGSSVVIMNESFTSTTLRDAMVLGREVMSELIDRDLLCVYVTFVDELASMGETTVSMVAAVEPDNPAQRTYKVIRRPADGLAYAAAIAEKHGLSYRQLKGRVGE